MTRKVYWVAHAGLPYPHKVYVAPTHENGWYTWLTPDSEVKGRYLSGSATFKSGDILILDPLEAYLEAREVDNRWPFSTAERWPYSDVYHPGFGDALVDVATGRNVED